VPHAVQARITRSVQYPYALFSEQSLDFNGNTLGGLISYDPATGLSTGHAWVGSNGNIQCNGGGNLGDRQDWFLWTGAGGCANANQLQSRRDLPIPVMPAVAAGQNCPTGNVFNGAVNGQSGLPFRCFASSGVIDFNNVTVSNPPLVVYVECTGNGDAGCVDLTNATVNNPGLARNFQLYMRRPGQLELRGGNIHGLLYAPQASSRINGGSLTLDGSLTVNDLRVNGGPNFNFRYEDSIREIALTRWRVGDYAEIPHGLVP